MVRAVLWGSLLGVGLIWPTSGGAHPGRLDPFGCHTVRHPYVYADGTRLPTGDYHCHTPLGVIRLNDRAMPLLPDPTHATAPDREEPITDEERNRP